MHHPPHLDIDIDKLITDENDPKFRVLLMLVKSLSDYLAGNTEAVNDMSNKLDAHLSAFGLWNKAGGREWAGLTRRRAAEAALYLEPAPGMVPRIVEGAIPSAQAGEVPPPAQAMPQQIDPESSMAGSAINRAATVAGTTAATIRVRMYSDTACTALLQDGGTITACPGLAAAPWTWTATYNANAFAYGHLSKAVAWFESQQAGVKGLKIDLADATNPAGYIDCARIVAGPWWQPTWGAEYGCTTLVVDNSTNARTDAGDLPSDRAPMHQELTLTMPALSEAERSQMMQIMRANGIWKPIFISLLPRAGTAIEQDHMIYGKRKNTPMDLPYFATFAHSMEIESW